MEMLFVNAEDFLLDSFKLAKKIYDSGFRPNFLVGVWRGGTPPAIAIQEFFKYKKVEMNHYPIKTEFYCGINKQEKGVKVSGLGFLERSLSKDSSLLIVDDVFDTGLSMRTILKKFEDRLRDNIPKNVKIATVYYKPSRNQTYIKPDFYIHETDKWIIFPHELDCLSEDDIKRNKSKVYEVIK